MTIANHLFIALVLVTATAKAGTIESGFLSYHYESPWDHSGTGTSLSIALDSGVIINGQDISSMANSSSHYSPSCLVDSLTCTLESPGAHTLINDFGEGGWKPLYAGWMEVSQPLITLTVDGLQLQFFTIPFSAKGLFYVTDALRCSGFLNSNCMEQIEGTGVANITVGSQASLYSGSSRFYVEDAVYTFSAQPLSTKGTQSLVAIATPEPASYYLLLLPFVVIVVHAGFRLRRYSSQ